MLISDNDAKDLDHASARTNKPSPRSLLRLWPGVAIVVLQWLARFGVPIFLPSATAFGAIAGLVGGLAIIVWWTFFSRAAWFERLSAVAVMVVALFATSRVIHESIATGAMGMMFFIIVTPGLSLAFIVWAVVCRNLAVGMRRATMVATILLACGAWTLVRTGGITGNFEFEFAWRWAQTAEERLLARSEAETLALPSTPAAVTTGADWPGFRGLNRDGIVHGVQIETDWSASPPVELWRRPVGPGWSSFAVQGDLFYTQEQRGDDEVVACYRITTGEPVWRHADAVRFWESNAGAGPRGTPALRDGRVYTLGGTGILNALDANDGSVVWSRNAAADTNANLPTWGFSSSPLVVDDMVVVAVSGALIAYDRATGEQHWTRPADGEVYSSPHFLTIARVKQVLQLNRVGLTSVAPADGALLWEYAWSGYPIVQPTLTANGDVLISVNQGSGLRRLAVDQGSEGWTVEERWRSNRLKPYYSDIVIHRGHAFGFDGSVLVCMDVEDGDRKWKGGRYGAGQLLLLADQGILLVLSERGELALVDAVPGQFTELARFLAIEGKTWNHPVLVGDVLLVRNAEEMAAFRLSLAGG